MFSSSNPLAPVTDTRLIRSGLSTNLLHESFDDVFDCFVEVVPRTRFEFVAFVLGVVKDFLAFGFDVLARFFEAFVGFFVGLFACGFADLFGLALGLGDPLFSVFLRLFDYLLGFAFCALYPVEHLWSRHVVLWGLYHGLFGRSGYRFALGTPP